MFAFTADNHINLRGLRSEIPLEDTIQPLRETVEYCLAHKLPLVLGGDLYDTNNPPARLVARVNEILARMERNGLQVWAIQGNHDKDPETPWGVVSPGVQWLDGKTVTIGGLQVHGLDFAPASIVGPRISGLPKCDIVVIHQALRQGLGFDDAWNCDLDWFDPLKVKNVLAGDLHRVLTPLSSTKGDVMGWYPGTPYMTTIDENPFPSFMVIKGLQPSGFLEYERVPLKHRSFHDITAGSEADLHAALQGIDIPGRPIVVLRYPADAQEVPALAKKVLKEAYIIEKPLPSKGSGFSTSRNLVAEVREGLTLAKVIREKTPGDPGLQSLLLDLSACRDKECLASTLASHRTATSPSDQRADQGVSHGK